MIVRNHRLFREDGTAIPMRRTSNMGGALQEPSLLVIHAAGFETAALAIAWLTNPTSMSSAHVVIDRDGTVTQMVPFDRVAWHAGTSEWRGRRDVNQFSLSVELVGPLEPAEADDGSWVRFPDAQINTAVEVARALIAAYSVSEIVGREDVSPEQTNDPGPTFPMVDFRTTVLSPFPLDIAGTPKLEEADADIPRPVFQPASGGYRVDAPAPVLLRSAPDENAPPAQEAWVHPDMYIEAEAEAGDWLKVHVPGDDEIVGWILRGQLGEVRDRDPTAPVIASTSMSDPVASEDLLGFRTYVEAFTRLVLHRDTTTPLVIAVMGEWGKGKSSFMRFLRTELESHGVPATRRERVARSAAAQAKAPLVPRAVTVWFDAWQYNSEEKVFAALLQTMAAEIQRRFTPYGWLKYGLSIVCRRAGTDWRTRYRLVAWLVAMPAAATAILLLLRTHPTLVGKDLAPSLESAAELVLRNGTLPLLGLALVWAWRFTRVLRLPLGLNLKALFNSDDQSARLGYLAVFTEVFRSRVEQLAATSPFSLRPSAESVIQGPGLLGLQARDFAADVRAFPGRIVRALDRLLAAERAPARQAETAAAGPAAGNRVVIFVDDLDRCQPNAVMEVLEAIKVSLDTPGLVFVLGMDPRYVKSSIYLRYREHIKAQQDLYGGGAAAKELSDTWPTRYLEKVIQLAFNLPDAGEADIRRMVAGLLEVKEGGEPGARPAAAPARSAGFATAPAVASPEVAARQRIRQRDEVLHEVDDDPAVERLLVEAARQLAGAHEANPRRAKSFVNRARLGLYLLKLQVDALSTDELELAIRSMQEWEAAAHGVGGDSVFGADTADPELLRHLARVRQCFFPARIATASARTEGKALSAPAAADSSTLAAAPAPPRPSRRKVKVVRTFP